MDKTESNTIQMQSQQKQVLLLFILFKETYSLCGKKTYHLNEYNQSTILKKRRFIG